MAESLAEDSFEQHASSRADPGDPCESIDFSISTTKGLGRGEGLGFAPTNLVKPIHPHKILSTLETFCSFLKPISTNV